jgi:hypothetical protein
VYTNSLVPSNLSSNNYDIHFVNGDFTILAAKQLLVTTQNVTHEYGSSVVSYQIIGKYLDDQKNVIITLTPTLNDNVYTFDDGLGTQVLIKLAPYTGQGLAATSGAGHTVVGNYSLKDAAPTIIGSNFENSPVFVGNLTVTTKAITPWASNVTKVYDGSTTFAGSLDMTGQLSGDDLSIGGIGAFKSKHVGTNLAYSVNALSLSGKDASNYHLLNGISSLTGNNGTITPASLVLSTSDVIKTYDGTLNAAGSAKAVQNTSVMGADSIFGGTFTFVDKGFGYGNKVVIVNNVTVQDGNGGNNYNITYVDNTTSTIERKAVTLRGIVAYNKTYDGTDQATVSAANAVFEGQVSGDELTVQTSGIFADKHVGNQKTVTLINILSGADLSNYKVTEQTSTTADITPRALNLSAVVDSKIYDGTTNSSGGVLISGIQTGDSISAIQVFDSKHALGDGASTLKVDTFTINDGNNGKNYIVTQTDAKGTIEKASLLVTATEVEKTYDGTTFASGVPTLGTLAGQAAGESVNTMGSQAFLDKNAGTNKTVRASGVTIKDSANNDVTKNYNIHYQDNTTSSIFQAPLSFIAESETRSENGLLQTQKLRTEGLILGDEVNVIGWAAGITPGFYSSTLRLNNNQPGADHANYKITFVDGVMRIVGPQKENHQKPNQVLDQKVPQILTSETQLSRLVSTKTGATNPSQQLSDTDLWRLEQGACNMQDMNHCMCDVVRDTSQVQIDHMQVCY